MFCPNRVYNKVLDKDILCKNSMCLICFIEKLKKENWHHNPESVFLKAAYERKIIKKLAQTTKELEREDKENLKCIKIVCMEKLFLE